MKRYYQSMMRLIASILVCTMIITGIQFMPHFSVSFAQEVETDALFGMEFELKNVWIGDIQVFSDGAPAGGDLPRGVTVDGDTVVLKDVSLPHASIHADAGLRLRLEGKNVIAGFHGEGRFEFAGEGSLTVSEDSSAGSLHVDGAELVLNCRDVWFAQGCEFINARCISEREIGEYTTYIFTNVGGARIINTFWRNVAIGNYSTGSYAPYLIEDSDIEILYSGAHSDIRAIFTEGPLVMRNSRFYGEGVYVNDEYARRTGEALWVGSLTAENCDITVKTCNLSRYCAVMYTPHWQNELKNCNISVDGRVEFSHGVKMQDCSWTQTGSLGLHNEPGEFTNSTIEINGDEDFDALMIYVLQTFSNCKVNVTNSYPGGRAIFAWTGDIVFSASQIEANGDTAGIMAERGSISMINSTADVYGDYALYAKGYSQLGGEVRLHGEKGALVTLARTRRAGTNGIDLGASCVVENGYSPVQYEWNATEYIETFGGEIEFDHEGIEGIPVAVLGAEKELCIRSSGESAALIRTTDSDPCVGMTFDVITGYANGEGDTSLVWKLPECVELIDGSVTINGVIAPYELMEDGLIRVDTDVPEGAARFTVYALAEGEGKISAGMMRGGENVIMDETDLAVDMLSLGLPTCTGRTQLTVSGRSVPGGTITIFDNGSVAGEAKIDLSGRFEAQITLKGTGSEHSIKAEIVDQEGRRFYTPASVLLYDPACAEVSKITITNVIHDEDGEPVENITVVDYLEKSATAPHITFWPEYPAFTFEMEMINCIDPLGLGDVYIATVGNDGTETYVPMHYDQADGKWYGTAEFTEYTVPESVRAEYTGDNFGLIELGDAAIPYRADGDGSLHLYEGDSEITVSVNGNTIDIGYADGTAYRVLILDEDRMIVYTPEGLQVADVTIEEDKIRVIDGEKTVEVLISEEGFAFDDLINGISVITNEDMTDMYVADASGNGTRYITGSGETDYIVHADGTCEAWTYSQDGLCIAYTARDGSVISYEYDDQERLTAVISPGNAQHIEYDGSVTRYTEANGDVTKVECDREGRIISVTYPGGLTVDYGYDGDGNIALVKDPMGNSTYYTYTADGEILSVADDNGIVAQYSYDENGMLTGRMLGNGARSEYIIGNDAVTSEQRNLLPDGTLHSRYLTVYDEDMMAVSLQDNSGLWEFAYDDADQLVRMTGPDGSVTEYTYTPAGTYASKTVNGETTLYTSNELNQITSMGENTYEYDLNGRLVRETAPEGETLYEWDAFGQLVRCTTADGSVYEYGYDAFGNRSAVTVNDRTTRYIWNNCDVPELIGAIGPDGSYVRYIQGIGLEAQADEQGMVYYQYDQLGSTVALTGPDGSVLNSYTYDPTGEMIHADESISTPFLYAGMYGIMDDGNGLTYMRARYLHNALSTFISPDPAGQEYDLNLYRYAGNNRVQYVDSTGLRATYTYRYKAYYQRQHNYSQFQPKGGSRGGGGKYPKQKHYPPKPKVVPPQQPKKTPEFDPNSLNPNTPEYIKTDSPEETPTVTPSEPEEDWGGPEENEPEDPFDVLLDWSGKLGEWSGWAYAAAPFAPFFAAWLGASFPVLAGIIGNPLTWGLILSGLGAALLVASIIVFMIALLVWLHRQNNGVGVSRAHSNNAVASADRTDEAAVRTAYLMNAPSAAGTMTMAAADDIGMLMPLNMTYSSGSGAVTLDTAFSGGVAMPVNADAGNISYAERESIEQDIKDITANGGEITGIDVSKPERITGWEWLDGVLGYWLRWTVTIRWIEWVYVTIEIPDPEPDDPPTPDEPEIPDDPDEPDEPEVPVYPDEPTIIEPPSDYVSPVKPVVPEIDPSGYVYEFSPVNRLAGVTATLYYKPNLDSPDEEAVVWNAADYGQVNPLITDAEGKYQWMVGTGWYQVVYEKDGYETARSEWLPVPPVQTEVNIGMVSYAAPQVKKASAWNDAVSIVFDKYINADSLYEADVHVWLHDGSEIGCDVWLEDEDHSNEYGFAGREITIGLHEYASSGRNIKVRIDGLRSYAGTPVESVELECTVCERIGGMEILGGDSCAAGESGSVQLRILAQDGAPMKGVKLTAVSATPSMIAIDNEHCISVADGIVNVPYSTLKAGTGVIRLTANGGGWTRKVSIVISANTQVDPEYAALARDARDWYDSVVATWTDGKGETTEIALAYTAAFRAESDRLRELMRDDPESGSMLSALDEWDAQIGRLLHENINGYLDNATLAQIREILFARVDLAYALMK